MCRMGAGLNEWDQVGPGPNEWAQWARAQMNGPKWARAQQGPNESPRMGPNKWARALILVSSPSLECTNHNNPKWMPKGGCIWMHMDA